jgi:hypothetical protein
LISETAVSDQQHLKLSALFGGRILSAYSDGLMQTGMVRSAGPQAAPNPALAALPGGNTTYVENGTNQYTICKQL